MSKDVNIQDNKILSDFQSALEKIVPDLEAGTELDIPDIKPVVRFMTKTSQIISHQTSLDDFAFARSSMHNLIENGQIALGELLRISMISDHPRAFEVVATLMKNIGDLTKDMLSLQGKMIDLQLKMKELDAGNDEEDQAGSFSGTTEELLKSIHKHENN